MILSHIAIKRPVFTTMVMLLLFVFGAMSFHTIGVQLLPKVEIPYVSVVTLMPGADPEIVETSITQPLEEALSTVSSIKKLTSKSSEGVSIVVLEFELDKNIDIAYQEVQSKVNGERETLPDECHEPIIEKASFDSEPVISLVVSGKQPIGELSHIANKTIGDKLQQIDGVGQVQLVGRRDRIIWLYIDTEKLDGYSLTINDVSDALKAQHVQLPGGHIDTGTKEYIIKTKTEFTKAAEFNELVLRVRDGYPIKFKDIGHVVDGLEEERSLARLNEKSAVAILVRKQSQANIVTVADRLKKELQKIQEELKPQNISIEITQDMSVYILESIHSITEHLILGGLLATLVVFLFLRNTRMTLISATAIPLSILSAFFFMKLFGFTINIMTMLALSLAIGILIDDAIVVIENIFRKYSTSSMDREQASEEGTQEIGLAAFAITLTIVAVFVPVAFMKGFIGRFFYEFGITVSAAVLMSLFVAFTLIPMLASKFLVKTHSTLRFLDWFEAAFEKVEHVYHTLIGLVLRWKKSTFLVAFLIFVISLFLATKVRSEFSPLEDRNELTVRVEAPLGYSLKATDELIAGVRKKISAYPWVSYTFTTIAGGSSGQVSQGSIYVRLVDKATRDISQQDIMQNFREELAHFPNAKCSVNQMQGMGDNGRSALIQLEISGSDLHVLHDISEEIMQEMRKIDGYVDIDSSYGAGKPEKSIYIRREALAQCHVSPKSVASALQTLVAGTKVAVFNDKGEQYDVKIKATEKFLENPEALYGMSIRNDDNESVPLKNLIDVSNTLGPVEITRINRSRCITIYANINIDKMVLGEAIKKLTDIATKHMRPGYKFGYFGDAENMQETFQSFVSTFILAILFIYMVLASQFESFIQPLVIMVSLPFSIIGALLALFICSSTLNIMTIIGIIMLMGLVTKNAILLVDYTNTLRVRDGLLRDDALQAAGKLRLRPILMTTLAMVFGMLPTAVSKGPGCESNGPMALAVIGGLLSSLFLTLLVVPAVYSFFDRRK